MLLVPKTEDKCLVCEEMLLQKDSMRHFKGEGNVDKEKAGRWLSQ